MSVRACSRRLRPPSYGFRMHTLHRICRFASAISRALPGAFFFALFFAFFFAVTTAPAVAASMPDTFFRAVTFDDDRGVERMMREGVSANLRNAKGEPALLVAVREASAKVIALLLQAPGIDIDARNPVDETPLMIAALKGDDDAVAALIAHGASTRKGGWTPLHYAATGGDPATVQMLLSHGALLEARSPNGSTPLMMAAKYGREDVVKALLSAGADRDLKNDLGMNAVAFAASAGRVSLANQLTNQLADQPAK